MIKFACKNCDGVIAVEKEKPGTIVVCGHCKSEIIVPEPFSPGFVLQDFKVLEKIDDKIYKCHQFSLDITVDLKIKKKTDKAGDLKFIKEGREKAKTLKVHAMGQEGDFMFQASAAN